MKEGKIVNRVVMLVLLVAAPAFRKTREVAFKED